MILTGVVFGIASEKARCCYRYYASENQYMPPIADAYRKKRYNRG
jgi:hypothetical protein